MLITSVVQGMKNCFKGEYIMCHLILFLPVFGLPVFWVFPLSTSLPLYLFITALSVILYFKVFKAMRGRVQTGQEGMIGKKAVVVQDIDPEGKVEYGGEIWDAITRGNSLFEGEPVNIIEFRGLNLLVE